MSNIEPRLNSLNVSDLGIIVDVDARIQKDPSLVLLKLFELELDHVGVHDPLLVILSNGNHHQLHPDLLDKPKELFVLVLIDLGKVVENQQQRYFRLLVHEAVELLQ